MSDKTKRGLEFLGGAVIFITSAFPLSAYTLFQKAIAAAADNPIRALFLVLGVALMVSAFWENILDGLGIYTNSRLLKKVHSWLHSSFKYSLIDTQVNKDAFKVVTQFDNNRFTITKDAVQQMLVISASATSTTDAIKARLAQASNAELLHLRESVVLELARLNLSQMTVSVTSARLEATFNHSLLINKELNKYRLMDGIGVVGRAIVVVDAMMGKWMAEKHP